MMSNAVRIGIVLTLAAAGVFLPADAMAAVAQHTGEAAHYLDEALLVVAGLGGLWLLDTLSWAMMTSDR